MLFRSEGTKEWKRVLDMKEEAAEKAREEAEAGSKTKEKEN